MLIKIITPRSVPAKFTFKGAIHDHWSNDFSFANKRKMLI